MATNDEDEFEAAVIQWQGLLLLVLQIFLLKVTHKLLMPHSLTILSLVAELQLSISVFRSKELLNVESSLLELFQILKQSFIARKNCANFKHEQQHGKNW